MRTDIVISTLEGPMRNRMIGGYTITDARFVSATREVPE